MACHRPGIALPPAMCTQSSIQAAWSGCHALAHVPGAVTQHWPGKRSTATEAPSLPACLCCLQVGHSAGGWLARLMLGQEVYDGAGLA